jgi:hypothetical protein
MWLWLQKCTPHLAYLTQLFTQIYKRTIHCSSSQWAFETFLFCYNHPFKKPPSFSFLDFFCQYWRLNSRPHTWKAGTLSLEWFCQPFFLLVIFDIGSSFLPSWPTLQSSCLCFCWVSGMIGLCCQAQLLIVMGSSELLPKLSSNPEPPDLCLLSSLYCRLEPLSLPTSLFNVYFSS